jgi:hypothetical protein
MARNQVHDPVNYDMIHGVLNLAHRIPFDDILSPDVQNIFSIET